MNKMFMKEDYVSYEVAKLLKKKGFNWNCVTYYVDSEPDDVHYSLCGETNSTWESNCCSAPTHQMAMKWLREKHIIIVISPECLNIETHCSDWGVEIWWDDNYEEMSESYLTYEDACGAAIKHVLENLN